MLRRTKQTRGADGRPMVGLPPKHVRVERVPLSTEAAHAYPNPNRTPSPNPNPYPIHVPTPHPLPSPSAHPEQEADFYEAVRSRSKVQFDAYVARDKALSSYASVLELLLRLRQVDYG